MSSLLHLISYLWDNLWALIAQGGLNTQNIHAQGYKGHTITTVTHSVLRHGSVNTDFHIWLCLLPTLPTPASSISHLHASFHIYISVVIADDHLKRFQMPDHFQLTRDAKSTQLHKNLHIFLFVLLSNRNTLGHWYPKGLIFGPELGVESNKLIYLLSLL